MAPLPFDVQTIRVQAGLDANVRKRAAAGRMAFQRLEQQAEFRIIEIDLLAVVLFTNASARGVADVFCV